MENENNYSSGTNQENRKSNRFWPGFLTGALVTAFAGLILVGMALGIYLVGRRMMRPQSGSLEITVENQESSLDYEGLMAKMELIQEIISQYFLYDEDKENVQEYIYKGMLAGLSDPYSEY